MIAYRWWRSRAELVVTIVEAVFLIKTKLTNFIGFSQLQCMYQHKTKTKRENMRNETSRSSIQLEGLAQTATMTARYAGRPIHHGS